MNRLMWAVAFIVTFGISESASAQTYPSRPITMIVPFAAGGGTDALARIIAEPMRRTLHQPLIIENVAGATGSIGVGRAVRAAGDGYTLSIGTVSTHVLIGALYALPYDLLKDLSPVAQLATEPLLIVTKKSMPAKDLTELIAWLRANPDKSSQGTPGVGSLGHLGGLLFQKETGTRFQFVPYRGSAPAVQDLVAGQIDIMIDPLSTTLAQVRAGTITAHAVVAKRRLAAAPEIPTADEAGLVGVLPSQWFGLWVPADTPKDIIAKLNAVIVDALADPLVRARLAELGQEVASREQQTPRGARRISKGRNREMVANNQRGQHQGRVSSALRKSG
jgi:tripartite-type tricarboxylate transporter receptor subunit TctC